MIPAHHSLPAVIKNNGVILAPSLVDCSHASLGMDNTVTCDKIIHCFSAWSFIVLINTVGKNFLAAPVTPSIRRDSSSLLIILLNYISYISY